MRNTLTNWKNRIVDYGTEDPEQLLANPFNARIHPQAQQDGLQGVLDTVGWVDDVIVNRVTGHVVDGHLRVLLAMKHGESAVPVKYVELTEHEEKLVLAAFDWITSLAVYDRDQLDTLLKEVQTDDTRLQSMLSEMAAANGLYEDVPAKDDPGGQVDRAGELQQKGQVKRGDVYRIGKHRLMCGDSTSAEDVARLMGGECCALVITDPPYGVEYSDKNKFLNAIARGNRIQTPIEGDYGSKDDIQAMWKAAFKNMSDVMSPGAVVYCFMPQGGDQMMMMMMMMGAGIEPRHELIWLKNNHVLGRVDYAYKHEPILYAWKEGGHHFYGDFQTSILEFDKPLKSDLHPTTKPVELVERLMSNSSQSGEVVYDPFTGSGTMMVAAQNLNRVARCMEISPEYCSVILERLSLMGIAPEPDT